MSKLTLIGIVFIILGILSGTIQSVFYDYTDSNGFLHDSLFLPLAFILIAVGVVLLLIKIISLLIKRN